MKWVDIDVKDDKTRKTYIRFEGRYYMDENWSIKTLYQDLEDNVISTERYLSCQISNFITSSRVWNAINGSPENESPCDDIRNKGTPVKLVFEVNGNEYTILENH